MPGTWSAKNSFGVSIFFGGGSAAVKSSLFNGGGSTITYGWFEHARYTESESMGLSAVGGRGGRVGLGLAAKVTADDRAGNPLALLRDIKSSEVVEVEVTAESRVEALR